MFIRYHPPVLLSTLLSTKRLLVRGYNGYDCSFSNAGEPIGYCTEVSKGGLDIHCPSVFARVLPVLETALYCPWCVVVFR